ncbi:transglutaminase-like cysteine peptidase [Sphingomonas jaspsi]|uniref:transglutaminase-like cysteine peptidase n=1 Tax=Sphingomonas jaspsi TaxID=392409 RepID=UPI00056D3363|nr:transglutaminase-like cysteine peptidase [Sphingomonas jaspsi]
MKFATRMVGVLLGVATASIASAESASVPNNDPLRPLPTSIRTTAYAAAAPNIFGTAALNAGVTIYDARFRRVAAADRTDGRVLALAESLKGLSAVDQLRTVKAEVERRVRFATDLDAMGVFDLWANAGETLARGVGDDEDIAIAEMQVLKAAGYDPADLYLSIGRHKVRGAHVVLVARTPEGFYMLDQSEPTIVAASSGRGRFVPQLTVGQGRSWIHGYRRASLAAR